MIISITVAAAPVDAVDAVVAVVAVVAAAPLLLLLLLLLFCGGAQNHLGITTVK